MRTFENIQNENKSLANQIANANQMKNYDLEITLKKQLYTNKLELIGLLEYKNKKNNVTAGNLIKKIENLPHVPRYETGLYWLDKYLKPFEASQHSGFEVGSLIILGGQSGAGKSHIMLDMLSNISRNNKCMFFNFEMGDRRIVYRLKKLLTTKEQLSNFILNSESRDLDDLIMDITIMANEGVKFFAIDSKMKITVKGSEAEHQKISKITKLLSEVAIKNDIILFLINQISEDNLKHGIKAFKGSGDQLYDADMALFLTVGDNNQRTLECTKNRQDEILFEVQIPKLVEVTEYQG